MEPLHCGLILADFAGIRTGKAHLEFYFWFLAVGAEVCASSCDDDAFDGGLAAMAR